MSHALEGNVSRRAILRCAALAGTGLAGTAVLAACGATPTPQTIKEVVTQVVEKEVTKIVESTPQVVKETVVVEVTAAAATGAPMPAATSAEQVTIRWWSYYTMQEPGYQNRDVTWRGRLLHKAGDCLRRRRST